jgi:hypothetical protein
MVYPYKIVQRVTLDIRFHLRLTTSRPPPRVQHAMHKSINTKSKIFMVYQAHELLKIFLLTVVTRTPPACGRYDELNNSYLPSPIVCVCVCFCVCFGVQSCQRRRLHGPVLPFRAKSNAQRSSASTPLMYNILSYSNFQFHTLYCGTPKSTHATLRSIKFEKNLRRSRYHDTLAPTNV